MAVWATLGERYLRSIGYEPRERLGEVFKTFSTEQAARYYQTHYGVPLSRPGDHGGGQRHDSPLLPGGGPPQARGGGVPPAAAIHGRPPVRGHRQRRRSGPGGVGALRPAGLLLRRFLLRGPGPGGKGEPDIFRIALGHLGTEKAETAVFEDALHAAQTARADGFPVVGICDPYEPEQEALRALADCYLTDYRRGERFFAFAAQMGIPAADRGHHSLSR